MMNEKPSRIRDVRHACGGRRPHFRISRPSRRDAALRADPLALGAPMKSFSLNSREFYDAVCAPLVRPGITIGALAPVPRARVLKVFVELGGAQARR